MAKSKSKPPSPFTGRWRIVSMSAWDQDFVDEEEEGEARTGARQMPVKQGGYVFKHLFVREKHACGAPTRAGTPCTRLTSDDRCRQHRA